MIKNNKIARKDEGGRRKEITLGVRGHKKGTIIRRCGPKLFLGLIILSQFVDVLAKT